MPPATAHSCDELLFAYTYTYTLAQKRAAKTMKIINHSETMEIISQEYGLINLL